MTQEPILVKRPKAEWMRLCAVLACTCASAWLYRVLVRLVPTMTSAEPTGAGEWFPWVKLISHHALEVIQDRNHSLAYTLEFMACCAGLFALYAVIMRLVKGARSRWVPGLAAGAAVVFMLMLLCSPVMLSSDTYAYAHYGRMLAVQGIDAHGPMPEGKQNDPFLLGGYYEFVPSVYGPLWTLISAGLVIAGGGHVGLTILLFRGLEVVSALGSGGLIWLVLKELAPGKAAWGTLLFLLNPLVVIESAMGGHNDTCMMALALLAVWMHLRGSKAGVLVALALSALVKVVTWPLVPLYMLMVIRRTPGWAGRAWFAVRGVTGMAAVVVLSTLLARMSLNGGTVHTAASAQFYENNYHELLFKGLRRLLGEPADSLNAPMDFKTWWITTNSRTKLHAGTAKDTAGLCWLQPEQNLLVISDEDSDNWLRVYDPVSRMQGYVDWGHISVIDDPPDADKDPEVARHAGYPPEDWPTVIKANNMIRCATWGLFVVFGLVAAWKTTDFDSFIVWGTAFFLTAQLLVFTKIWPWYVIWPLAYGALKPEGGGMRLAIMLSAGGIISYSFLDYANTDWSWFYDYRSIPTIVLPAVLCGLLALWDLAVRRRGRLAPQ